MQIRHIQLRDYDMKENRLHLIGCSVCNTIMRYMPFSRHFNQSNTVMRSYILHMVGPGNQTHYPGVTSAMLYHLSYKGPRCDAIISCVKYIFNILHLSHLADALIIHYHTSPHYTFTIHRQAFQVTYTLSQLNYTLKMRP